MPRSQPVNMTTIKSTNFLFIMYDDLRPELSIYGKSHMITPNFERLAARGITFDNVYCQVNSSGLQRLVLHPPPCLFPHTPFLTLIQSCTHSLKSHH